MANAVARNRVGYGVVVLSMIPQEQPQTNRVWSFKIIHGIFDTPNDLFYILLRFIWKRIYTEKFSKQLW